MNNSLTWVEINAKNLLHNLAEFRKIIPSHVKIMAVVKANAYGHGIKEVGKVISSKVDWFGVNNLEEALILKEIGVQKPILILGYTPLSQLEEVAENGFRQVVYNQGTIIKSIKTLNVHLKVETGMNRQGIDKREILNFVKLAQRCPSVKIEGIYTHLADTEDETNQNFTRKQLATFKEIVNLLEENGFDIPLKHTANTAAAILFPEAYFDLIRLGIGMHGLWPAESVKEKAKRLGIKINLRPVLTWKTQVAQIKKVKKGETIGYGCAFKATKDSKIAVLAAGYFDGYTRKFFKCGEVLIGGKKASVVGRICMNMIMVDITEIPDVKLEQEVVLLGKQGKNEITAEDLAEKIGTNNYEIVTRINPLISRQVV